MATVKPEHVLVAGGIIAGGIAVVWFLTRPAAGAETGSLSGRVLDLTTNLPIVGVVVEGQGISTTTDGEGLWTLAGLAAGQVLVTFSVAGFAGWTQEFTVVVNADTPVGDIPLQPTVAVGRVFGVIVDANTLQPIDASVVTIAGRTAVTGPDGVFDFLDIPTGQYTLTVDAIGYAGVQTLVTVLEGDNNLGSIGLNPTQTAPPTLSVTATPESGQTPLSVAFQATATGDLPLTYAWDFGDGVGSSTEQNPNYVYANPGSYSAICTVTDPSGRTAQDSVLITVTPPPSAPTAELIATPSSGDAPLLVSFDARGIGGLGPYTYAYTFGDGNGGIGQGMTDTISNNYLNAGLYTASVVVTDQNGLQDTATVQITVTPPTQQTARVWGWVRDMVTNAAMPGVAISLDGLLAITDATGFFEILDVPFGTYTATFTAVGYTPQSMPAVIDTADEFLGTAFLTPVAAGATVTVMVADLDVMAPLPGATVTLNGFTDIGDANGRVTFYGVPFGTYTLTASATGYTPNSRSEVVDADVEDFGMIGIVPAP